MSERQEVREREGKRGGNREAERVGEAQVRWGEEKEGAGRKKGERKERELMNP